MNENEICILRNAGFCGKVGFGKRPAIVVVDFSEAFTNPEIPLGSDYGREMANTNRILKVMREKDLPVIFTTIEYSVNRKDAGVWAMKCESLVYLTKKEYVEINKTLNYNPEKETLIIKKGASAFFGTNLSSVLVSQGCDTVIVAGVTTSGCVRATVVDSCQYGFRTIVARDAVGDRAQAPHEANLFDMNAKYSDVLDTKEILEELKNY